MIILPPYQASAAPVDATFRHLVHCQVAAAAAAVVVVSGRRRLLLLPNGDGAVQRRPGGGARRCWATRPWRAWRGLSGRQAGRRGLDQFPHSVVAPPPRPQRPPAACWHSTCRAVKQNRAADRSTHRGSDECSSARALVRDGGGKYRRVPPIGIDARRPNGRRSVVVVLMVPPAAAAAAAEAESGPRYRSRSCRCRS